MQGNIGSCQDAPFAVTLVSALEGEDCNVRYFSATPPLFVSVPLLSVPYFPLPLLLPTYPVAGLLRFGLAWQEDPISGCSAMNIFRLQILICERLV
jgi:hypothetical protein